MKIRKPCMMRRPNIFIVNAVLYFTIAACLMFVLVDDLTSKSATPTVNCQKTK